MPAFISVRHSFTWVLDYTQVHLYPTTAFGATPVGPQVLLAMLRAFQRHSAYDVMIQVSPFSLGPSAPLRSPPLPSPPLPSPSLPLPSPPLPSLPFPFPSAPLLP